MSRPEPEVPLIASEDQILIWRAAEYPAAEDFRQLTVPVLARIAETKGLDFATGLLYERLVRSQPTRSFLDEIRIETKPDRTVLFGLVPGAFYQNHKHTGADGARIIELIRKSGCECQTVPIRSFGTLEENAALISRWLAMQRGKRVALVSLSKGSADLKIAIQNASPEIFDTVISWVSFSGIVHGTPLINWLKDQRLRLLGVKLLLMLRGQSFSSAEDLKYREDGPLSSWSKIPPQLQIIHICGFPRHRHLRHPWAPRAYRRLAKSGPNDGGGILLGDVGRLPGIVYPVWGADHYLQPLWDCTGLLRNILARATWARAAEPQANRCAQ
jgi:hypothetical protein